MPAFELQGGLVGGGRNSPKMLVPWYPGTLLGSVARRDSPPQVPGIGQGAEDGGDGHSSSSVDQPLSPSFTTGLG